MKPPGGHLDDETFDDGFVKLKIDIFSVKSSYKINSQIGKYITFTCGLYTFIGSIIITRLQVQLQL